MKISQYKIAQGQKGQLSNDTKVNLVLVFADRNQLETEIAGVLVPAFPNAEILYCSTAGEIMNDSVSEGSICITAIEFEKTELKTALINIRDYAEQAKL